MSFMCHCPVTNGRYFNSCSAPLSRRRTRDMNAGRSQPMTDLYLSSPRACLKRDNVLARAHPWVGDDRRRPPGCSAGVSATIHSWARGCLLGVAVAWTRRDSLPSSIVSRRQAPVRRLVSRFVADDFRHPGVVLASFQGRRTLEPRGRRRREDQTDREAAEDPRVGLRRAGGT